MYELFPQNVRLLSTERYVDGGMSLGDFENFNLALHVNDSLEAVKSNRLLLKDCFNLPSNPKWINQTHSSICINASLIDTIVEADASYTSVLGTICGVLTADCLPVFISKKDGSMVGVAHAGWRGLLSGIVENLIEVFNCDGSNLVVHLGPAISMSYYEVGEEIKDLYISKNINFLRSFSFRKNRHFLDLYDAARVILEEYKISSISGGNRCTYKEEDYFFSYRRDGIKSGRMAHLIWIE